MTDISWIYNPWINQRELIKWLNNQLLIKEEDRSKYRDGYFEEIQQIKDHFA